MAGPDLPRVPAEVAVYVEALGLDDALRFILAFGGSQIYVGRRPGRGSQVTRLLGLEKARALGRVHDRLPARVPLVKGWCARMLYARGLPIQEIARRMHCSDTAVRRWLDQGGVDRSKPRDPRQMTLF